MNHRIFSAATLIVAAVAAGACTGVATPAPVQGEEIEDEEIEGDELEGEELEGDELEGEELEGEELVGEGDDGELPETPVGFCGSSGGNGDGVDGGSDGDIGGYPSAKAFCESTCGDSDAHMCTLDEMILSAQDGTLPGEGYYWFSGPAGQISNGDVISDCKGWTSDSSSDYGNMWGEFNGEEGAAWYNCRPGEIGRVEIACCT